MAASCSIIRNKKTNEIEQVLAPNGQPSILWQNLINIGEYANNKEQALRVWAKAYTRSFKEEFGNWELLQEAKELAPQIPTDLYRKAMEQDPEQTLFEVAHQYDATKTGSVLSGVENIFGLRIPDIADALYPDAVPGDVYQPKMSGKIDVNGEPLIQYILPEYFQDSVQYVLKAVIKLSDPKIVSSFSRFHEKNPEKFKQDLIETVGRQQAELVLEWIDRNRPVTLQDVVTGMLSEYSYVVQIETAATVEMISLSIGELPGMGWEVYEQSYNTDVRKSYGIFDTEELANKEKTRIEEERFANRKPTQHYVNMNVPGGTKYTENEIYTPEIIPSITGHAEFSTENGIGWFRSDDKVVGGKYIEEEFNRESVAYIVEDLIKKETVGGTPTNTRRIIEIQSDLFQKGRRDESQIFASKEEVIGNKYKPKTQFLQLLSKDNNWVTVFVKAIIQDSAKKGYEKVLFPTGNTANKVEGQQTLEGFLQQKESRLDVIRNQWWVVNKHGSGIFNSSDRTEVEKYAKKNPEYSIVRGDELISNQNEIAQLKTEIIAAKEGRLKSSVIHNFYETIVFNILKKQGYSPIRISDEYGNGWYEISISDKMATAPIVFNRNISPNYKQVLSEDNRKIFEDLIGQGLVTSRRWNGMYFVPKQRHEIVVSGTFESGRKDYRDGYFVPDPAKYRQLKAVIDLKQLGWLDVTESKTGGSYIVKIIPDRQAVPHEKVFREVGEQAFRNIADRLSKRLNIPYEIIDVEQAMKITKESQIPWNGEGAFAFKGKVYILQDALSIDNAIHEFAHFFVEAVAKESPYLIKKLYGEFQNDPVAKSRYIDLVNEIYSEFSEEDKMKEAMVRAITDKAMGLVDETTGNVILDAVRKIWRTLANIIRNLFGVSVKNLNENTTLDQLAAILLGEKEGEVIDLGDRNTSLFQGLFPMFNREMANQLEKLSTSAVQSSIESFFTVIDQHWKRIREDRDLSKLREVLSNEKEGTLVADERQLLKLAQKFSITLEENTAVDRAALTTFAEAIEGQEIISQRMADHVATFDDTEKEMSTQEKLAIFRKYSFIAREWGFVFEKFNEAVQNSPVGRGKNPLSDAIQNISNNFKFIDNKIKEFYLKDGLVKIFKEELESNPYYQASIAEQKQRIKELEESYAKFKNPSFLAKINKEKELLRRYELTDDTIASYLSGEMGDTNYYSMYLESYTSNPDPIVGTFTNWFLKQKFKAEVRSKERLTKFENKVSKLYKKLGFKNSDFRKVAENLVQKETFFDGYKDYKGIPREAWTFINQYGDDKNGIGWDFEYNRLKEERESAKNRMFSNLRSPGFENKSGEEEFREKSRIFEQYKLDYMFDEEADIVREARLFWFRDDISHAAKIARDEIIDRIRKNSFTDISKDETIEKHEENKNLWKEFRKLSSITDSEGKEKTGRDLEIAKVIQEYNKKYGNLYENVEIKGMFDANAKAAESQLLDELMASGKYKTEGEVLDSKEYQDGVQNWYRDNIRVTLSKEFYDTRKEITERISRIISKIEKDSVKKKLDIGAKWEEILEVVKGYRDDDNQPIGTELSETHIARVKALQQDIEEIKEVYNRENGMTDQEATEYFTFLARLNFGQRLSDEDFVRFQELSAKTKLKLSREDQLELNRAFDDLKGLQSKISTPYYADVVNDFLAKSGSELRIGPLNAHEVLNPAKINPILNKNPEFKAWWNKNHLLKERWDNKVQNVIQDYERLYVWNRTVPNDNLFKTLLETGDFKGLSNYNSKFVEVKKGQEYYYKRLRPEYLHKKSKETEWVTHDNKGRWLPKPTRRSATDAQRKYMEERGIPYADDRFENKTYLDLKENKADLFELLNVYKEFHLETQENLARYARLGLEVPRLRKNSVENSDLSQLVEKPKSWWKNISGWLGAMFMKRQDDFELGSGNYNPQTQASTYVLTDLMGDQINSIPIKYMSHVDPELVSMDIGKAVSMYAVSAETNKVLQEINPIASALKETLETNKPKDVTTRRRNIIQIVVNAFDRSSSRHANKKGGYNRLKIISNFLERELEGHVNIQQLGPTGEKVAGTLMKIGAWGSLGLNLFAALKNALSGRVQNNLESVMGSNLTPSTLAKSNVEFAKLLESLLKDYYSIGEKSFYTQLFLLFDPLNYYRQKAGTNFSKTAWRDAIELRWIMAMQKFGEINVQGSAWLAMMLHQKVDYTDPETGASSSIPYLEAWELKDGVVSLKEGVDPKWSTEGANFLQFAAKVHKVNELNQGAYSEESQPEINRMTLGKLFLFMRKFYIPGAVNRFSPKRFNAALGSFREGYWMPLFDMIGTATRNVGRGHVLSTEEFKSLYSPAERRAMLRTASELGFIMMMGLLIKALGFDGDDEDRYEKLESNSWIHNFLIYQTMMVKSEAETFVPFYGMGVNESVRLLGTPSIAFNTAKRWVKLGQDFLNWTVGSEEARYERDSGIYKEGQLKFLADLLNIIGYKNFSYLSSNQDLQEGLKLYAAMQRRI